MGTGMVGSQSILSTNISEAPRNATCQRAQITCISGEKQTHHFALLQKYFKVKTPINFVP
jgi:hypothetical protein